MKNHVIKMAATISIFSIFLSGCATIVSGSSQLVHVQAIDAKTHKPIPNARCQLIDSKKVAYTINSNPGSANIPREYGKLQAECTATGYKQKSVATGQSFNAWTLADVIFWPGALVDAATGAAKKYPSHITVLMQKSD